MDAVDREELIGLLAEALMRDPTFRPRRRHWAADADRCRLEARICAAGLVDHLALLQKIVEPHCVACLDQLIPTRACGVLDFCNRAALIGRLRQNQRRQSVALASVWR